MIWTAEIKEVCDQNDRGQYCYEGAWTHDAAVPCTLRHIAGPGRYDPYEVGDIVLVALPYGDHTCGRIIGLFEPTQAEPSDRANTEIHARGEGAVRMVADRVDAGPGSPSEQKPVGIHEELRGDIDALHDLLGPSLSTLLAAISAQIVAGGGGSIAGDIATWAQAYGQATPTSSPAEGLYAKPEGV